MSRPYKVKRYKRIYARSPASLLISGIGALVVVCVLGFVGWSAYTPVMEYLSGIGSNSALPAQTVSEPEPSQPELALRAESASPVIPQHRKAVYLPADLIGNSAQLTQVLDALARTEINTVLFDLKDTQGNVLYTSQLELVKQAQSQVENPYDLASLCNELKQRNLLPMGRLQGFLDPIAASRIPDAGILYLDTNMLWLDNSPEQGGKPWLNPYSQLAQAYLTDLATEAVSMGVKQIILDNISFPTGYGLELASFGSNASNLARSDLLAGFLDAIETQVVSLGGTLNVYISGLAALGAQDTYYGSNPLALANDNIVLGVMPAQFGDRIELENFSVTAPVLDPQKTVDGLLKVLAPDLAGKRVVAMLQGYNAPYTVVNNKVYTADDINAQIAALSANQIEEYIIYHPNGTYPMIK